jgi:hypothetical protein
MSKNLLLNYKEEVNATNGFFKKKIQSPLFNLLLVKVLKFLEKYFLKKLTEKHHFCQPRLRILARQ